MLSFDDTWDEAMLTFEEVGANGIKTTERLGIVHGADYGSTDGNIGNNIGDTFWHAAAEIVQQCYQLLPVGGVAAWVTGDFVRKGERVYFGKQWATLCESAGFTLAEHIIAHKYEHNGTQLGVFGDDEEKVIDRVSFFRRLSTNRARAAQHWETVDKAIQGNYQALSHDELMAAYTKGLTPPDEIPEPVMPQVRTVAALRQYEQASEEYNALMKTAENKSGKSKPPNKGRILQHAQMLAWLDAGSERLEVEAAILNEDVWIMVKA
jgi:hypothetical protein